MGLNLESVDAKLFREANSALSKLGATISIDKSDPTNPVVQIQKGIQRAELPVSKNILKLNGKIYPLPGLTIIAAKTGKIYLPQQAVDLILSGL